MCFSAGASFGASAVLVLIGVVTLTKVQTRTQLPFAAIPLLFGVQQATEGVLWVMLGNSVYDSYQHIPTMIFLIFAQVVWPIWVPYSIMLVERDEKRKRILKIFSVIGAGISGYLALCLMFYNVHAEIDGHHIHYLLEFPLAMVWISGIVYFLSTVVPPFVASGKLMQFLGMTIMISFIFTTLFYEEYVLSVWCFFAAVLSGIIFLIMNVINKENLETSIGSSVYIDLGSP